MPVQLWIEYDPHPPFGGIDWTQVDRDMAEPVVTQWVQMQLADRPIDSVVMRLARLGLIGAVLLVALHAFLFASGDGHHGNPVPGSSIAEGSVHHDGVRTALWSSVQTDDVADDCMPAIIGLAVLLLGLTGGQPRRPATVVLRWAAPVAAPPRHPRLFWASPEPESTSGVPR